MYGAAINMVASFFLPIIVRLSTTLRGIAAWGIACRVR